MALNDYIGDSRDYTFPGTAGSLQATGVGQGLTNGLGSNCAYYHASLVQRWKAIGGWVDRDAHVDPKTRQLNLTTYMAAGAAVDAVLTAEGLLRWCERANHPAATPRGGFVSLDGRLRSGPSDDPPLPAETPLPTPGPGWVGTPVPPAVPAWGPPDHRVPS